MSTTIEAIRFDEDVVKLGLMGNDPEREQALESVYEHYSLDILRFLERKLPGLPTDLGVNAMLDAFKALNEEVLARTFDYDKPLRNWLIRVARNKGVDELRRISRRTLGNSEFFDTVGECLANTEVGRQWRLYTKTRAADEIAQEFRDFLLTLPPVQRQVGQIMADSFPDAIPEEEICDEIFRRVGKRPTVVQVKSAKREIRKKFKDILNK
jgi:DNA-directed RNA polymerase specialized sigma24 family protein